MAIIIVMVVSLVERLILTTPRASTGTAPHAPSLSAVPLHHAGDPAPNAFGALVSRGGSSSSVLRPAVDDGDVGRVDIEARDGAGGAETRGGRGAYDAGSEVHGGNGELGMRDPVSAREAGVGITDVASPNNASISSNLTPAVSGYTKYTRGRC